MSTYVQQLAGYIAGMEGRQLPSAIVTRLQSCLLYNLSMGLAGYSQEDVTWDAVRALHPDGGMASLLVTGERRPPQEAAFANAALITSRGQNDTLRDAVGHLGCIVIPAALAVAQDRGADGATVMAALAAGYETQAKIARGAAPLAVKRGFRATPVFGVFGAAAAAARVMGLSAEQCAHALAIASNFAAGTMQCWAEGTMEWRIQVANASRAGVVAALLAEKGVTGAGAALEGASGFFRAFAGETPPLQLDDWGILRVMFKPYPGCAINQGPVHALLRLMREYHLNDDHIEQVTVTLSPDQVAYPGVANYGPFSSASGAVMSTAFMLTVAMRDGALYQRHFTAEFAQQEVNGASRKVVLVADPAIPSGSSRIAVRTSGGARLEGSCVDEDEFIFSWEETVRLVQPLAAELNVDRAGPRIAGLVARVGEIMGAPCVAPLFAECVQGVVGRDGRK